jgi:hypothetical protein
MPFSTDLPARRLFVHEVAFDALLDELDSATGGFVATRLAPELGCGEHIILAVYSHGRTELEVPVVVTGRCLPLAKRPRAPVGVFLRLDHATAAAGASAVSHPGSP